MTDILPISFLIGVLLIFLDKISVSFGISNLRKTPQNTPNEIPSKTCNCKFKQNCPVNGKCLTSSVIYEAILNINSGPKKGESYSYIGLTKDTFKKRFTGHNYSFRHKTANQTTLSSLHHKLNDEGSEHSVEWKILEVAKPFDGKKCNLCYREKWWILNNPAKTR